MSFPLTDAQSYGLFLESVFYGIYLVSCASCIRTLCTNQRGFKSASNIKWGMVLVTCSFFSIATIDALLQFYRNLHTFATTDGPAAATVDFSDISNPINVIKTVTVRLQISLADGMLVYRCWIIYNRSWLVIAAPLILWLAGLAITGVLMYLDMTLKIHALLSVIQRKPFSAAFWAMTITMNILTTGLIVARIYKIDRSTQEFRYRSDSQLQSNRSASKLQHAIRIIVESGLMYAAAAIITFATYVTNNVAVYVTTDLIVQIIGIAFNLIIIRAARHATEEELSLVNVVRPRDDYPLRFMSSTTAPSSHPIPTHINVVITHENDRESETANETKMFEG